MPSSHASPPPSATPLNSRESDIATATCRNINDARRNLASNHKGGVRNVGKPTTFATAANTSGMPGLDRAVGSDLLVVGRPLVGSHTAGDAGRNLDANLRAQSSDAHPRPSSPPPPLTPTREVEIYDHIIVVVKNFIEIGRFPINEDVSKDEALRHAEMFKAGEDMLAALEALTSPDGGEDDDIRFARAAIARARGETP